MSESDPGSSGADPGSGSGSGGFTLDSPDYDDASMYLLHVPVTLNRTHRGGAVAYRGHNDTGSGDDLDFRLLEEPCPSSYPQCFLTSDPGYIIYSALGSFYIPMCIMVFFYWKIYRAAVGTNKALQKGMIVTKTGSDMTSGTEEKAVTLRVHRGGSANSKSYSTTALYSSRASVREPAFSTIIEHETPSSNGVTRSTSGTALNQNNNRTKSGRGGGGGSGGVKSGDASWRTQSARVRTEPSDLQASSPLLGKKKGRKQNSGATRGNKRHKFRSSDSIRGSTILEDPSSCSSTSTTTLPVSESVVDSNRHVTLLRKLGTHNLKNHIRKINKEKKAAKTVGIIVGGFILCWFPFFTCYLLGAFCADCTPPLVFSIFFWLGYCNSAINPCVYALFSKDFR